jgi:hypothetical protein
MNIYEKAGDLVIDVAKLVIGGVILGAIMINKDASHTTMLYIAGGIISFVFIAAGFLLYRVQKKQNT